MPTASALEELSACEDVGFVSLREEPEFELCVLVEATDPPRRFEIRWSNYISYAVRSEHYCQWDPDEVWEGKHVFRTYTRSKFLDFVAAGTFANDLYPGPFRHYQIQSLYPIIDVAAREAPQVRVVWRGTSADAHAAGKPRVRPAIPGDAPALAALFAQLGFPGTAQDITARLAAAGDIALVAVVANDIVGVVTTNVMPVLHRPAPVGRISALVVDERHRGAGIGRRLVDAAEALLAARGCGLVEVTSHVRLEDAHAFYRRLGYEATSHRFRKDLVVAQEPPRAGLE